MKKILLINFCLLFSWLQLFSQADKPEQQDCFEQLNENLENFSGLLLYQIYLNIDVMNNNSDVEENYEMFDNYLFILEVQLKQLKTNINENLDFGFITKEKIETMKNILDIIPMIQEDIDLFRDFLIDNTDENFNNFFEHHIKVNKKLEEEFSIEELIKENSNGELEDNEK